MLTFWEFHGPGPAEGTGEPVQLYIKLLHCSFHHTQISFTKAKKQGSARPRYTVQCGTWASSMRAGQRECVSQTNTRVYSTVLRVFSPPLASLVHCSARAATAHLDHSTISCCDDVISDARDCGGMERGVVRTIDMGRLA